MKKGMIFLTIVVLAVTLAMPVLGAEQQQQLPSSLKINPANIKTMATSSQAVDVKFKLKFQELQNIIAEINNVIPPLEHKVNVMLNKREECLTKAFTTADMTAAGCNSQAPLADCERKLFFWCFHNEWNIATAHAQAMNLQNLPSLMKASQSARDIFREWVEYIVGSGQ